MTTINKKTLVRKKILVFFPGYIQKSESFIVDQLEWLSENYELCIYTFNRDYKENYSGLISSKIIYDERFSKLYSKGKYPYIDRYNEQEKKLYIYFLKSIGEYIRKYNIDSILCQFLSDSSFISNLKQFSKNISIITMCRGRDIYCEFPLLIDSQKEKLLQNIDHFFVRDQYMFDKALSYNFLEQKLHISNTWKVIWKYNFQKKDFSSISILFWGRIVEKKWILKTLNFLEWILKRDNISIKKIILLWDYQWKDTYSLQVRERINWSKLLSKHIESIWFLDQKSYMDTIHNQVNIFMWHYQISADNDQDGIPNVLLENMLVWNLCFSTISWGISEVIIEWKTWYILTGKQNDDILKFEQRIWKTHTNMLQNTRSFIETTFNQEREIRRLIKHL